MAGAAADAAPTCRDQNGGTIRCGTRGAMPVGWSPPPRSAAADLAPAALSAREGWALAALVGAVFALIALMPRFDGWSPGDWDRQEGDDDRP